MEPTRFQQTRADASIVSAFILASKSTAAFDSA
jgi:hypothetical protein